jgi:DNA (cytosine-5)-methyltransferase 3A
VGDNTGFDGKSGLFWEYVRILNEVKPTYFLLENVIMKKEWEDIITEALNVKPIEISSAKFVPQARRRLYWTNIPNVGQPEQKHYNIYDFIDGEGFATSCGLDRVFKQKNIFNTLTATYYKGIRGSGRPAISIRESFLDDDRDSHRMLTPEECERLQTIPIGYTKSASNTQRYKMLGNGWTVDVIAHIFSLLKNEL